MQRISLTLSCSVLAASTLLGLNPQADAADPYPSFGAAPLPRAVVPADEGYYDSFMGGATTYEESVMQGEAALMRAVGAYELNTAEAFRSYEAAVDQALDNQVKQLEVRHERERMARIHKAEMERTRLARRAEARASAQARAEAEAAMSADEKAAKQERLAAGKLKLARRLQARGRYEAARRWMQEIVVEYPGTAAAREITPIIAGQ